MKNKFLKSFTTLLTFPLLLTSCSKEPSFAINRDSRYSLQSIQLGEDNTSSVCYATINAKNEANESVTLNKDDFKLKTSAKQYDCLYFITEMGYHSDNGDFSKVIPYIKTTTDTLTVDKNKDDSTGIISWKNIYIAFEANDNDSYDLLYKNEIIKNLLQ